MAELAVPYGRRAACALLIGVVWAAQLTGHHRDTITWIFVAAWTVAVVGLLAFGIIADRLDR